MFVRLSVHILPARISFSICIFTRKDAFKVYFDENVHIANKLRFKCLNTINIHTGNDYRVGKLTKTILIVTRIKIPGSKSIGRFYHNQYDHIYFLVTSKSCYALRL